MAVPPRVTSSSDPPPAPFDLPSIAKSSKRSQDREIKNVVSSNTQKSDKTAMKAFTEVFFPPQLHGDRFAAAQDKLKTILAAFIVRVSTAAY